ncbi:MAG: tRNA (adenosine(37)-N6)-threonylcarbamoyltransferase complex ATPase subunit type 1 TsaE [candidate division Zixibacteria bacterium]
MLKSTEKITVSVAETESLAAEIARSIAPGDIIALYGAIGAGKTSFVRGLATGLGCAISAKSPSFNLINEYPGVIPLYHIDFYRLEFAGEMEDLGWTDYLDSDGIVAIEWAERVKNLLPDRTLDVYFEIINETSRKLEIYVSDDFRNRKLG